MNDKRNQPPAPRDPYAKPGFPLGMVAQMRTAALQGNLVANFGVGAPAVTSRAQALPPPPQVGAVVLAHKAPDGNVVFYAYAQRALSPFPTATRVTKNAFVYRGRTWSPTRLDEQMLSNMSVVGGSVPAGRELKIMPATQVNAANQLVLAPKMPAGVSGQGDGMRLPINGAVRQRARASAARTNVAGKIQGKSIFKPKPKIMPLGAGGENKTARKLSVPNRAAVQSYVTRTGDTLRRIADEHGITMAQLRALNPSMPLVFNAPLARGFTLNVPKRG